jgi:tRNA pseudouridine55 synthase
MADRTPGPSGWLVIDKPTGITSARAVSVARRALGTRKIGHGGTLDPLASGVLPLAVGEATKTVAYAMAGRKLYRFTVRWGEQRTTDDAEGEVIATSDHRLTAREIRQVLPRFIGYRSGAARFRHQGGRCAHKLAWSAAGRQSVSDG